MTENRNYRGSKVGHPSGAPFQGGGQGLLPVLACGVRRDVGSARGQVPLACRHLRFIVIEMSENFIMEVVVLFFAPLFVIVHSTIGASSPPVDSRRL